MLIVGIVGGIASGKSLVANYFKELGAVVLDADRAGHEILNMSDVRDQIRNIWGNSVFQANGQVDRKQLGKIVFASQGGRQQLSRLEQITHPRIKEQLQLQIKDHANNARLSVAILDAPLLFEAGWDDLCDLVIFVESSYESRLTRARERGWSREDFDRRESLQLPLDEKRLRATSSLNNDGSNESVRNQVLKIWNQQINLG